jgi:NAD+ diphosphatase
MKNFKQLINPPINFNGKVVILVYHDMEILIESSVEGLTFLDFKKISSYYGSKYLPVSLGIIDGIYYSAIHVDDRENVPVGTEFVNIRQLYRTSNENFFYLAGFGRHLADWDRTFRFCGMCGSQTNNHTAERAKVCPSCGHSSYPKISPAMICSVTRGNEILLARGSKFTHPVYSVLAGFVEPGETLEETVEREIMEETSISVRNIRYFGNQPWPFSSSMMIAFTAEYESGVIKIDNKEIIDANWFRADNLPMLPSPYSIARRLIMDFVERTGNQGW